MSPGGWGPWAAEDPDGAGSFELAEPRRQGVADYAARVSPAEHDERLHEVVQRRAEVVERAAVEDIDEAAALLGALSMRAQQGGGSLREPRYSWGAGQAKAQQWLDESKRFGREVLAEPPRWSGERSTDELIAHAREVLARSVPDRSDAVAELERRDAVARWAADDEIALADADGVLDGWQW